ncbi:hypothetical protein ALC56_12333 [Trachymyrmex septentrionalis]|uniref:Uncharacterized protein n=1 Tax=Trachymyrmex septentrionalis TaxID=34720 RepID=A0A195EZS9_9HYME|nr:hypothetical protein ALC56_12333 [Trachymyrmex septentrionalis]
MSNERCELRHSLQEDGKVPVGEREDGLRERKRERCRDVGSLVRARSDMLDVGDTGVVWHITPLIQCISGCKQLARESQPLQSTICCVCSPFLLCNIANSSACFKSLASRSGFPPMPIPPLAASRRRVSFAIVNCIFEFRNVFAFSNNLLSAKYNRNIVKSIYTLKLKLMRSAKQLVCDLFLSRNCEIKSFRQLMSSRATPSDTAASFEIISLSRSTCTVEIKDHQ